MDIFQLCLFSEPRWLPRECLKLLSPFWICLLLARLHRESSPPKLTFSACYGALLVRALAKTRKLNLANTSLTAEQVKRLLKSFLSDDCTLENLDLSANVLSMIEPDLMAKSLNKLKVVTLLDSDISVNQVGKKYNILLLILIFIQVSTIFKKALADTSLTSFWT